MKILTNQTILKILMENRDWAKMESQLGCLEVALKLTINTKARKALSSLNSTKLVSFNDQSAISRMFIKRPTKLTLSVTPVKRVSMKA
jgi:hypothetical protein